jgi:stringent starvation protein B
MPTKQRPYLIRAMHEWMTDNGLTPHLVVDATRDGVQVPPNQVTDGKIVLNVSYTATHGLVLGNDTIAFQTRFAGVPHRVELPVGAVIGIYARETGQGMLFSEEEQPPGPGRPPSGPPPSSGTPEPKEPTPRRGNLKVVK